MEGGFAADAPVDADGPTVATFADVPPPELLFYVHEVEETVETPAPTPHAALGVGPEASWREIKAAHRRLLAQLHPDRFVTATERQQREAADRLAEVNLAYHQLSKERTAS